VQGRLKGAGFFTGLMDKANRLGREKRTGNATRLIERKGA